MPVFAEKILRDLPWKRDNLVYLALIVFGLGMVFTAAVAFPSAPSKASVSPTPPYSAVNFPSQYRTQFIQYATVQRPDGTIRNLYINPEAITFIKRGSAFLPDNTVIVIDGYYALKTSAHEYQFDGNGRYVNGDSFEMLHVIEKRDDWTPADFVGENRIGNWNFGSFDMATGGYFDENMSACFHCHNATSQTDFLYSASLLGRYLQTGEVQFFICDLPDRIAC